MADQFNIFGKTDRIYEKPPTARQMTLAEGAGKAGAWNAARVWANAIEDTRTAGEYREERNARDDADTESARIDDGDITRPLSDDDDINVRAAEALSAMMTRAAYRAGKR